MVTLGIIGVVAAITIPTLIQNYKEKAWNTASMVFERKLSEATKVMNTQMTLIGYNTTRGFVDELSQHMKILKTCDSSHLTDCFSDKFYWGSDETEVDTTELTTSENLEKADYETELVGVMFANGVNAIMTYNKHCRTQDPYSNQINTTGCIGMIYDVDGFKMPNTMGKDLRGFNGVSISTLGDCDFKVAGICMTNVIEPVNPVDVFKDKATYDSLSGSVYNYPYEPRPGEYGYDEGFDWRMDYWASARYTCQQKGMDLPSSEQLKTIAKYLYGYSDNDFETTGQAFTWSVKNGHYRAINQSNLSKTPFASIISTYFNSFTNIDWSTGAAGCARFDINGNVFISDNSSKAASAVAFVCVK